MQPFKLSCNPGMTSHPSINRLFLWGWGWEGNGSRVTRYYYLYKRLSGKEATPFIYIHLSDKNQNSMGPKKLSKLTSCLEQDILKTLLMAVQALNTSSKQHNTTSLGILFYWLVTCVRKFFLDVLHLNPLLFQHIRSYPPQCWENKSPASV